MSFFIDETNFLAGLGLDKLFKAEPDYQPRDNSKIEEKISEKLPYKHVVNVEGSDIKVDVFHSNVTDEQLAKIATVINDTFKVCQKYKIVPSDTNVNFRMFLFEDREQYVDMRNSSYHGNVPSNSAGVAILTQGADTSIALSDVLMYRESDDKFPFGSDSFDKIDYLTLSHEFVHCVQNMARSNGAYLSKPVREGSAEAIVCEALHGEEGVPIRCLELKLQGLDTVKSNSYTIEDIYFDRDEPGVCRAVDNPYTTGMAMLTFLHERHPEAINMISEYHLDSSISVTDLLKKISCINNSGEFIKWVDDYLSVNKVKNPNVTSTLNFFSERHPEIIEYLSEWFFNSNLEIIKDFGKKLLAINCSGEFKNWKDEHSLLLDQFPLDNNIL
jgi:hypothetical protein